MEIGNEIIPRISLLNRLPRWLRIAVKIILIVTLVFYIIKLLVWSMNRLRELIHWATDIRQYRIFWFCVILLLIGSFIMAQFVLELDPVGKTITFFEGEIEKIKDYIIDFLK